MEPFAPPLLTRSICLVTATYLSKDPEGDPLVSDILASVQQCFDSFEVATMPSLWSLQSLLLLITCPRVPQPSMLTSAACRMALLLGLHKPQNPRLLLFWSCVLASRWDSLCRADSSTFSRPSPDLMSLAPSSGPEDATIFTWLFTMVTEADQERCGPDSATKRTDCDWEGSFHEAAASIGTGIRGLREIMVLTRLYLMGKREEAQNISEAKKTIAKLCPAVNLNPFASALKGLGLT